MNDRSLAHFSVHGSRRVAPGRVWTFSVLTASVALAFTSLATESLANPSGATVVNGAAGFSQNGKTLTVTNTPGAIINWQSFSIGQGEVTRFVQQNASSAVLNRVVSGDPSQILGQLQSNGRVFLINPNGITIGAGARIDTAAFVASSLGLKDADFLAGKMRFDQAGDGATVINHGTIVTQSGGHVYFVGKDVANHGVIHTPKGEIILAAGKTVELINPKEPNVRVEVSATGNSVVNLGQIIATGGVIGLFGGSIRQAGVVSANTAEIGANGKIVFKAKRDITLEAGSRTEASGPNVNGAGTITVHSETGTVKATSATVEAKGSSSPRLESNLPVYTSDVAPTNIINVIAASAAAANGLATVAHTSRAVSVSSMAAASGNTGALLQSIGLETTIQRASSALPQSATSLTPNPSLLQGGEIRLLGDTVIVTGSTQVDASGELGGGMILVGGDYQGKNTAIQNARNTAVTTNAVLKADAELQGRGGKVIVWADHATHFTGSLYARGGTQGGNGGFGETSGKNSLYFRPKQVSLAARTAGAVGGRLLLDPNDVEIGFNPGSAGDDSFSASTGALPITTQNPWGTSVTSTGFVDTEGILQVLNTGTSVTIQTNGVGSGGNGDIRWVDGGVFKVMGGNATLTLLADRNITIAPTVSIASDAGQLNVVFAARAFGGAVGSVRVGDAANLNTVTINTNGGALTIGGGDVGASGLAIGNAAQPHGISLEKTNIFTAGGTVNLRGQSHSTNFSNGINLTGASLTSTALITLSGNGMGAISSYGIQIRDSSLVPQDNQGIYHYATGTAGQAILIDVGAVLGNVNRLNPVLLQSNGGAINLQGTRISAKDLHLELTQGGALFQQPTMQVDATNLGVFGGGAAPTQVTLLGPNNVFATNVAANLPAANSMFRVQSSGALPVTSYGATNGITLGNNGNLALVSSGAINIGQPINVPGTTGAISFQSDAAVVFSGPGSASVGTGAMYFLPLSVGLEMSVGNVNMPRDFHVPAATITAASAGTVVLGADWLGTTTAGNVWLGDANYGAKNVTINGTGFMVIDPVAAANGLQITGNFTAKAGGMLTWGLGFPVIGATGNRIFDVGAGTVGAPSTMTSTIAGGNVGKYGAGALVLGGANTYTGQTWAVGGTLIGDGTSLVGAAIDLSPGGTVLLSTGASSTIGRPITGSGVLNKTGTGTIVLGQAGTYLGPTNVLQGTLELGDDGALGQFGAGNETFVAAGASLNLGGRTVSETISINGNGVDPATGGALYGGGTLSAGLRVATDAQIYGTGTLHINGTGISGAGNLTIKHSAGRNTNLNGGNAAYSGNINVTGDGTGGVVYLGSTNSLGATSGTTTVYANSNVSLGPGLTSAENWVMEGGSIVNSQPGGTATLTGLMTLNAVSRLSATGNASSRLVVNGVVSGAGGIDIAVPNIGTVVLGGANSYSGMTTVAAGALEIRHNTALGGAGVGTTIGDAARLVLGPGLIVAEPLSFGSGTQLVALNNGALSTVSGTVALGGGLLVNADATSSVHLSGVVSGVGNITKSNGGTLQLSNNNSYAGGTVVSGGSVAASGINALGIGTVILENNGVTSGTLGLSGATLPNNIISNGGTITATGGSSTVTGTLQLAQQVGGPANTTVNLGANTNLSFAGAINAATAGVQGLQVNHANFAHVAFGAIGQTNRLASLLSGGGVVGGVNAVTLNGNVSTTGFLNLAFQTTLASDVALSSSAGSVNVGTAGIRSDATARGLTITAFQDVQAQGALGTAANRLKDLSVTGNSVLLNGAATLGFQTFNAAGAGISAQGGYDTTGLAAAINFQSPVTLTGNLAAFAANGNVSFGGTVNGTAALNATAGAGNQLTFSGAVGGVTALTNIAALGGSGLSLGGPVRLSGNGLFKVMDANVDLVITQAVTRTGTAAGTLAFEATRSVALPAAAVASNGAGSTAITFNADTDATGGGSIQIGATASIASGGGAINLTGGTVGSGGFAQGTTADAFTDAGVLIQGSINANAGSIVVKGKGHASSVSGAAADGVQLSGANARLQSSAGMIAVTGLGGQSMLRNAGVVVEAGASVVTNSSAGSFISLAGQGGGTLAGRLAASILIDGSTVGAATPGNPVDVLLHSDRTSGSGIVAFTNAGAIMTGGVLTANLHGGGSLEQDAAANLTANGGLRVLSNGAAGVTLNAVANQLPVLSGALGGSSVVQVTTAGNLTINALSSATLASVAVTAGGALSLQGALTTANGPINLTSLGTAAAGGFTLANSVNAGSGVITLSANGGTVQQTGGALTGGGLVLSSTAPTAFTLNAATNNVGVLSGAVQGSIQYTDFDVLTIASQGGFAGLSASAGVTVRAGGTLTVGNLVAGGAGSVNLASGGGGNLQVNAAVSGNGVALYADNQLTFAASLGTADLAPATHLTLQARNDVVLQAGSQIGTSATPFAHNVTLQAGRHVDLRGNLFLGNQALNLSANASFAGANGPVAASGSGDVQFGGASTAPISVVSQGSLTAVARNILLRGADGAGLNAASTVAAATMVWNASGLALVQGGNANAALGGAAVNLSATKLNVTAGSFTVQGGATPQAGGNAAARVVAGGHLAAQTTAGMAVNGGAATGAAATASASLSSATAAYTVGGSLTLQGGLSTAGNGSRATASITNTGALVLNTLGVAPVNVNRTNFPGGLVMVGGNASGLFDVDGRALRGDSSPLTINVAPGGGASTAIFSTLNDAYVQTLQLSSVTTPTTPTSSSSVAAALTPNSPVQAAVNQLYVATIASSSIGGAGSADSGNGSAFEGGSSSTTTFRKKEPEDKEERRVAAACR